MRLSHLPAALALTAFLAPLAFADDPGPANGTIPSIIIVVGQDGAGAADPLGDGLVVVRDLANNPVANAEVVIDFSNCGELRLCNDPLDPDAVVNCSQRTVTKHTDANGVVHFRVVGWSAATPGGPGSTTACARVFADGVLFGSCRVAILDLSGGSGLTPADLSAWIDDFVTDASLARGDYDGSASLGPNDLSIWLNAFFNAKSVVNCGPGNSCP